MTVHLDREAIGLRIRKLRIAAGFPVVAEFARRVELEAKTLHRIERGLNVPSSETLASIASAVGTTVDELLFGKPSDAATSDTPARTDAS